MNILLKHVFWQTSYGPYGTIESQTRYEGWLEGKISIGYGADIVITSAKGNVLFKGSAGLLDTLIDKGYAKLEA